MENQNWFASWFDSPWYPILYQNRDPTEANYFIDGLVDKFSLSADSYILDLACGQGRHALRLAEKGYSVLGLDLSPKSIEEAKKNNLKYQNLNYEVHDMRLDFGVNQFDAVLNLFTSFGYFEDSAENLKVLQNIEKSAKKGALILIDFMNAKKVIRNLVLEEVKVQGDIKFHLRRWVQNNRIMKEIRFTIGQNSYNFTEQVQALFLEDFQQLLSYTNLQLEEIYGSYHFEAFDEKKSDRLILKLKKC